MNRYDVDYYQDVSSIKEILKRMNYHLSDIADALHKSNTTKAVELSGDRNPELSAKAILDVVKVITDDYASKPKVDIPLTITNKENKK